jgi:UDP:flavonoid glycosyltransferase YjiC (YdhE family)
MRVLMALWWGGGTVPVEVGVARRLAAAGHEVTVLGEPRMAADVRAAGAAYLPWERAPQCAEQDIADYEARTPVGLFPRLLRGLLTGPAAFDAAVVDEALLGAMVATESLGIPTAVSMPNLYLRPTPGEPPFGVGLRPGTGVLTRARDRVLPVAVERLFDLGLGDLNRARTELGLAPLPHVWSQLDQAERVLLLTAEALHFPAPPRPANVRYVGPVLDDPVWADVDVEVPEGDAPLVVVGLSSGRTRGQPELLGRILEGLAQAPVRAVVTTGPTIEPAPSPRPGIVVTAAAPHSALLAQATAAITHGGHGTVIKALAAGVPLVVLPLGRDQPDNAARVVWHGAGIRLSRHASARRIGTAVRRLVTEPTYRMAAEALGARIRAETDDRRIVAEVEALPRLRAGR